MSLWEKQHKYITGSFSLKSQDFTSIWLSRPCVKNRPSCSGVSGGCWSHREMVYLADPLLFRGSYVKTNTTEHSHFAGSSLATFSKKLNFLLTQIHLFWIKGLLLMDVRYCFFFYLSLTWWLHTQNFMWTTGRHNSHFRRILVSEARHAPLCKLSILWLNTHTKRGTRLVKVDSLVIIRSSMLTLTSSFTIIMFGSRQGGRADNAATVGDVAHSEANRG